LFYVIHTDLLCKSHALIRIQLFVLQQLQESLPAQRGLDAAIASRASDGDRLLSITAHVTAGHAVEREGLGTLGLLKTKALVCRFGLLRSPASSSLERRKDGATVRDE
jgi:hypothetical protein